jgi:hypothetical protein
LESATITKVHISENNDLNQNVSATLSIQFTHQFVQGDLGKIRMLHDATQAGRLLAKFLCVRYVHFVRPLRLLTAITCAWTRSTSRERTALVAGRRRNGTLAPVAAFDAIERQTFVQNVIVTKEKLSFNECKENVLNKKMPKNEDFTI